MFPFSTTIERPVYSKFRVIKITQQVEYLLCCQETQFISITSIMWFPKNLQLGLPNTEPEVYLPRIRFVTTKPKQSSGQKSRIKASIGNGNFRIQFLFVSLSNFYFLLLSFCAEYQESNAGPHTYKVYVPHWAMHWTECIVFNHIVWIEILALLLPRLEQFTDTLCALISSSLKWT